jgi:hypothetical protein
MTLDEGVLTLYETLGEPTDFRPTGADWETLDNTSKGYSRCTKLLNSGQTACANFKSGRGNQVRFSNLIATTNVTIKEINTTFGIDNNDDYRIYINKADLPNPGITETNTSGRFEDSFLTIDEIVYNVDWDEYDSVLDRWYIVLTVPRDTDSLVRDVKISKNSFMFLPTTHPWVGENFRAPSVLSYGVAKGNLTYVLKINNISDEEELVRSTIGEDFLFTSTEFETPTSYILLGKTIKFDTIPDDGTRFAIDYYRTPSRISDGGENFEIPEQFHYGIIMWATWQGLLSLHELETSNFFKSNWYNFMQSTKNDNDYKWERTDEGSGSIRSK